VTGLIRTLANREVLYWLILISLLASFCTWQLNHLEGFSWDSDEGVTLMMAQMSRSGYSLYVDIWTDQPPLFTASIAAVLSSVGYSVAATRAVTVLYATIGLFAVALLARQLSGRAGGLAAVVMLAITPNFSMLSRAVMPGLPAASLAMLSVSLAFVWLRTGQRRYLVVSGVMLAFSALVKPIAIVASVPVALAIILRGLRQPSSLWRWVTKESALLAISFIVPLSLCLLAYNPQASSSQLVGTYLSSKRAYPLDIARNGRKVWRYLFQENLSLSLLAIYGAIMLLKNCLSGASIIVIWLVFTLIALLTHSPLWPKHHLVLLLCPSAVLAGGAIDHMGNGLRNASTRSLSQRASLVFGLGIIAFYLWSLPRIIVEDAELQAAPAEPISQEAVDWVISATQPDDFIVTDYQMIAFRAKRRLPPLLCNTSEKRIKSRNLTGDELIAVTVKYDPKAILVWDQRFEMLPAYVDWVKRHYRLARWYDTHRQIYVPFKATAIQYPQHANLGDRVTFLGYSLSDSTVEAGDKIYLTLYWQAQRRMETSYTVFVHLTDRQGQKWGQKDNVPVKGSYPTKRWSEGETVVDEYEIVVDRDAPPGEYVLRVGMYDPLYTKQRLPIIGEDGEQLEDRILLKTPLVVGGERVFDVPKEIQYPTYITLSDKVTFLGYSLTETEVKPGGTLHLTLHWRARKRMDTSYKVFTHLLDSEECVWGQRDSVPCDGDYPTTGWLRGEVITDEYEIPVRAAALSGEYAIKVGMYEPETMERLAVSDENGNRLPDDRILLSAIRVGGK